MVKTKLAIPTLADTADLFRSSMRRVVVNPTIAGYRPMPVQQAFHNSRKKGKAFLGGNRAGKTVAGATETVMKMCGEHPNQKKKPPLACRAIGSSFEEGIKKIIMPAIVKWLPPSQLINGSWEKSYDLSSRTLTLENGSILEFLTYEQDVMKHAGTSRDHVWFDEEPPEEIFNENMLRLVDVAGEWCLTMTPLQDMSWTYQRIYMNSLSGGNPDIEIFHADTLDNIYINPTELEILLTGLSDEEKDARTHGTYYNLSGGIFAATLSQENFINPIIGTDMWPFYYHKWGHFGMLDHGYTNPTAFHLACYNEEGKIIVYDEYRSTKTLVKENAENILQIIADHKLTSKLDYVVCDPSTKNTDPIKGSSVFNEYAENGLFMIPGNNDVQASISRINALFKDKNLLITRNCNELVLELPQYRWAKFTSSKVSQRKNPQEVPIKKNDHSIDAVRYGIMSRPQMGAAIAGPVGNVLHVAETVSNNDVRYDTLLRPHSVWDNPDVFDEVLGTDW